MKTRTGFVSNSSSSSFIVSFEKDPANYQNLVEMMGDCEPECDYGTEMTDQEVIDRVYSDLVETGPATEEALHEELESEVWWEAYTTIDRENRGMPYDQRRELEKELRTKLLKQKKKQFKAANKDKYVYIFDYADDGGEASLEHGRIFRNVEHTRVSHH